MSNTPSIWWRGKKDPRHPDNEAPSTAIEDCMMLPEQFWAIIKATKSLDREQQLKLLESELNSLSKEEIEKFAMSFAYYHVMAATQGLSDIIQNSLGGLSDDGFSDFCNWMISQGQEIFEKLIANPGFLVDYKKEQDNIEFESIGYVAGEVYEKRFDEYLPTFIF